MIYLARKWMLIMSEWGKKQTAFRRFVLEMCRLAIKQLNQITK